MVAAVHFYATEGDQQRLLDYLGEPEDVTLLAWPLMQSPAAALSRTDALSSRHVTVANRRLNGPVGMREDDAAMNEATRAGVFNRLNWERLKPKPHETLTDPNKSPVLFWTPATLGRDGLASGSIGSQADSMKAVSDDYERWVNRVTLWVRSRGTKVWGLDTSRTRPNLDVRRPNVTTVFALPEALKLLETGTTGL
ncbi:hypothetical protein [Nocardioides sp. 1609]|uniref:hypothetical protein n=1 Tax=Nocardioides sp. 1609 TaxID=2508327 RepID=UPI00106F5CEA|nr:hypothetical protein [Nocardioides sp. 1609]